MRIGFIRHGVTDWNLERRAQGQLDIPLNDAGRKQAQALGKHLAGEPWDRIYASDLSRAKETADIIAQALHLNVHTDKRLREMSWGEAEGTTIEERLKKWGEDWRAKGLNIESEQSILDRGISFVEEILKTKPGRNVLVVSHGALLSRLFKHYIPHVVTTQPVYNTSLTIMQFVDGKWECDLYNSTAHLSDE